MEIYISYSRNEAVTYCFLKYFLESCGIWVTEEGITDDWKKGGIKVPHVIILDSGSEEKIGREYASNCIYLVKKRKQPQWCTSVEWKARKDVWKMQWWNHTGQPPFQEALDHLLAGEKNRQEVSRLLKIFWDTKLWGASWLFHEIAQSDKGCWDEEIEKCCIEARKSLRGSRGRHSEFMDIYCQYIICGVCNRRPVSRTEDITELIEKCMNYMERYGQSPVFSLLMGKICTLSTTENKCAISYYESVNVFEKRASVYYAIGHLYEKAYGYMNKALEYYRKACSCDREYYKALYKIAVSLEDEGKWMEALGIYGEIKKLCRSRKRKDSISVCEVEYFYKSDKHIVKICEKRLSNNPEIIEQYRKEIEYTYQNLEEWIDFGKLMGLMFGREAGGKKAEEIREEIKKKFNTKCYQIN